MKRRFLVFAVWLLAAGTCLPGGERVRLKGQVVLQNSNGTPVPNAQVFAVGISSTVTDGSGYFEFTFSNRKPGDSIKLNVVKKDLEVVNEKELDIILRTIPGYIHQIVLCKVGQRDEYARIYYGLAETAINNNYEEQLKKVKGDVRDRDKAIAALKQERDAALSRAEKMAKDFAAVNMDAAPEMYKKAFALFKEGDIDGALAVLDDSKLTQTLHDVAVNFMLKADLYILKLDFERAETYYGKAIEAEPGNLKHILSVSTFLYKQRKFDKAQLLTEKALSMTISDSEKALFLNNLGILLSDTTRFTDAEKAYAEALNIYRALAQENKNAYLPNVANTLNNLGTLYYKTTRFTDAEKAYAEALNIRRALAQENKNAYLPDVAMTLNNLGTLYSDTTRFTDAEKAYAEALNIRRALAQENKNAYLPDVAMTLNNLGLLYSATTRFTDAEKAYAEALNIRRALAQENPEAYMPDVAISLHNLGLFHFSKENFREAISTLDEAKEIRETLAQNNPSAFDLDLCSTLIGLGILHTVSPEGSKEKALSFFNRAISILKKYPDIPQAKKYLEIAEKLKKDIEMRKESDE